MDSHSPIVADWGPPSSITSFPALQDDDKAVGYFNGGTWIAFFGLDLSDYTQLTMSIGVKWSTDDPIGFDVRLNAPDGPLLADAVVFVTAGWDDYWPQTWYLQSFVPGVYDVYIVARRANVGNGNIDWIEFHP